MMPTAPAVMLAAVVAACVGSAPSAPGSASQVPDAPPATVGAPSAMDTPSPPTGSPTPTPAEPTPWISPRPTDRPSAAPPTLTPSPLPSSVPAARLVGQKLVVRIDGTVASPGILGRIRRGEVGGVILFGFNVTTPEALTALTTSLQKAAQDGGQPPLLIAIDQEGGNVNRIAWAPPTQSALDMGTSDTTDEVRAQGAATGEALASLGINVDLAPVADVPGSTDSFMYKAARTFSFDATGVSTLANAFAAGLASNHVLATMKHFPGIGLATANTDGAVVSIPASADMLDAGLDPYRAAVGTSIPIVMLSNATYPAYDPAHAAGWSAPIGDHLLRETLGFAGVTVTDSLTGTALARGISENALAIWAAAAGTDLILVSGDEASSATVYASLVAAADAGTIPIAVLETSSDRIAALKASL